MGRMTFDFPSDAGTGLFFGSDVHATAAANLFSLIASCQLHGHDPETYLRALIRVLRKVSPCPVVT